MPLRLSRNSAWGRVRVCVKRTPHEEDMASGSFRIQFKIQTYKNGSENKCKFQKSGRIGQGGNFPAQGTQVDWVVDLGHPCRLGSRPGGRLSSRPGP